MSAKFPRGGGGAGPFLARSLKALLIGHRLIQNLINHNLTNGKSETPKRVLCQTVKTQMKCGILSFAKTISIFRDEIFLLAIITCAP